MPASGGDSIVAKGIMSLLFLGFVSSLLYGIYLLVQKRNIKVGAIVQYPFYGNPAMITTALLGSTCSQWAQISDQDAANTVHCDVPGACGLRSSWLSNGSVDWAQANPDMCMSSTKNWWVNTSCTLNEDCNTISHITCGSEVGNGCGSGTSSNGDPIATCSDAARGHCVIQDPGFVASCSTGGHCRATSYGSVCPITSCSIGTSNDLACFDGMTCEVGQGLDANGDPFSSPWGTCSGIPTPFLAMNVQMVAEGTVSSLNDDSTADVYWDRVRVLYPYEGPAANWWYTDCRFIMNPDDNSYNQTASAILLGNTTSFSAQMVTSDPLGFGPYAQLPVWASNGLATTDEILPAVYGNGFTAWGLASTVPVASMTRLPAHSFDNMPVTQGSQKAWFDQCSVTQNFYAPEGLVCPTSAS